MLLTTIRLSKLGYNLHFATGVVARRPKGSPVTKNTIIVNVRVCVAKKQPNTLNPIRNTLPELSAYTPQSITTILFNFDKQINYDCNILLKLFSWKYIRNLFQYGFDRLIYLDLNFEKQAEKKLKKYQNFFDEDDYNKLFD